MSRILRGLSTMLFLRRMKAMKSKTHEDFLREGLEKLESNLIPCDHVDYGKVCIEINDKENEKIVAKMNEIKKYIDMVDEKVPNLSYDTVINIVPFVVLPTLASDYFLHGTGFAYNVYKHGVPGALERARGKATMADDINAQLLDQTIYEQAKKLEEIVGKHMELDKFDDGKLD